MYRLEINGTNLDIDEAVPIPLSYSVADFKKPEGRKRSHSKTISLPGTANNLAFFESAYNISLTSLENPTLAGFNFNSLERNEAKLYYNDLIQFNGLAQLTAVKINNNNFRFELILYSNFIDIFQRLGDTTMAELGWGEYDHALNQTNVSNSFNTSVIKNSVATSNFTTGVPQGFGYIYGLVEYGYARNLPADFRLNEIVPLVYVKESFEKVMDYVGLSFTSSFFNTARVRGLIWGFGGGEKVSLSTAEVNAREVDLTSAYSQTYNMPMVRRSDLESGGNFYFGFNAGIQRREAFILDNGLYTVTTVTDTRTQYVTPKITIAKDGYYKVSVANQVKVDFVIPGDVNFTYADWGSRAVLQIRKNGQVVYANDYGDEIRQEFNTSGFYTWDLSDEFESRLVAGDEIEVVLKINILAYFDTANSSYLTTPPTIQLRVANNVSATSINVSSIEAELQDGDTVQVGRFVPDMKAVDWLQSIIRMFNLYFSDPSETGDIDIEPVSDWYQGTNVYDDWTAKLDESKEIEILPAASVIDGKTYKYSFAQDNDYYNELYLKDYGLGYGDRVQDVPTFINKGERETKIHFAQTVPVQIDNTDLVIPHIIKRDQNSQVMVHKGKPRIHQYAGMRTANWRLLRVDGTSPQSKTTYPCLNHLDSLSSPTFDLNFKLPEILYWVNANYTTNNLYEAYHRKPLRELTDPDAKVLRAYFKLDERDILELDFSKLKMIKGVAFRLNEIKDYDSSSFDTTYCELIKVAEATTSNTFNLSYSEFTSGGSSFRTAPHIDYVNKITQSGTSDPDVGTPLSNGAGISITSAVREDVGQYLFTFDQSVLLNGAGEIVVSIFLGILNDNRYEVAKEIVSGTELRIYTYDFNVLTDDVFNDTTIEIQFY